MNYYSTCFIGIAITILFSSCGGNKKQNECVQYFDSVKAGVAAHETTMKSIVDTLKDVIENSDAALFSTILVQEELKKKNDPSGFKTRSLRINPAESFIVSVEALRKKDGVKEFGEDGAELPLYRNGIGAYLLQYGEDIRSGKKDCFNSTQVNYLKRDIDDYMKIKYLVVTDCIFHKMPQLSRSKSNAYTPGLLVKEVRVIETGSRKMVQQYYITANSSSTIYVTDNDISIIQKDLRDNFTKKLVSAVYGGNTPRNLNHFNPNNY
jgi:hypothetical protein